ncbi:hypothetical protein CBL_05000 [Carabus blaptoides fortunei]
MFTPETSDEKVIKFERHSVYKVTECNQHPYGLDRWYDVTNRTWSGLEVRYPPTSVAAGFNLHRGTGFQLIRAAAVVVVESLCRPHIFPVIPYNLFCSIRGTN